MQLPFSGYGSSSQDSHENLNDKINEEFSELSVLLRELWSRLKSARRPLMRQQAHYLEAQDICNPLVIVVTTDCLSPRSCKYR